MRTEETKRKNCQKCGEPRVFGEPDPCIGYLSNVAHACCGHGDNSKAMCSGFPGCKPNESLTAEGKYRKGFWIKYGKEALDHMGLEE